MLHWYQLKNGLTSSGCGCKGGKSIEHLFGFNSMAIYQATVAYCCSTLPLVMQCLYMFPLDNWCYCDTVYMFPLYFDAASPSSSLPLDAIIGACAGGAGIAVLFLLIIIVCLCICRLRVNRRGFYPTYEDKTSEPPTMLRYSASLRSISSQTVIPVTEGRSVQKENEFYV